MCDHASDGLADSNINAVNVSVIVYKCYSKCQIFLYVVINWNFGSILID